MWTRMNPDKKNLGSPQGEQFKDLGDPPFAVDMASFIEQLALLRSTFGIAAETPIPEVLGTINAQMGLSPSGAFPEQVDRLLEVTGLSAESSSVPTSKAPPPATAPAALAAPTAPNEVGACPLGLACEKEPLQVFSQTELAELDADDAPELARLLANARRPANLALLSSLARGLLPAAGPPLPPQSSVVGTAEDAEDVRRLLCSSASRPRSVAALAQLLAPPPPPEDAAKDEAEARRLLSKSSRPRTRAILQLAAARLAAEAARRTVCAETRGALVCANADAPASQPSFGSAALLVYQPGTRDQASRIAELIGGTTDGRPLPSPLEGANAYLWPLRTRYFSANLWLIVAEDDDAHHAELVRVGGKCGALLLLYDAGSQQSWDRMSTRWGADLAQDASEILIVVGEVRQLESNLRLVTGVEPPSHRPRSTHTGLC